jgi:L-asparagine oxygenase
MSPKQLVQHQGYALLPSFLPDHEPAAAATALGVPEQVEGLRFVQELLPTTQSLTTPNTYSGNFGLGAFPLHTDLAHWARPPRYLMLRCSRGDKDAHTQIVDGRSIVDSIGSSLLARCLSRPRRPMKGTFQLLPIWQTSSEQSEQLIRWDSIYLKPANEHAEKVFRLIEDCLSRVQPIETVLLNEGDTLLVDNWRLLHGRSTVQNPASPRRIHRVYLSYLT